MICEKCKRTVSVANGEYVFYANRIMFACKTCAEKLNDEIKCARMACTAIDGKKTQAEFILNNKDAYEKFLKNMDNALKKIPNVGTLHSDIQLLLSFVNGSVADRNTEIPYNIVVAVVGALLYVISPFDMVPDVIPNVGYEDDAVVVAFCIKMFRNDLEKY